MTKITLGERLSQLIRDSGLEQKQVAETLGIKKTTFNGYVKNTREPKLETLMLIADYFNVSVDYLTGHTDIRKAEFGHLPENLNSFVLDPENIPYLEAAKEMKAKSEKNFKA